MRKMINRLAIGVLLCSPVVLLAGCGGGGASTASTSNPTTSTLTSTSAGSVSGVAQDGYLANALVCLDLNLNGQCDNNEPSAYTDANGNYNISLSGTGITSAQAASSAVLVQVKGGVTVDKDTGQPVSSSYSLYAPPGYKVVNPITTMVTQHAIASGSLQPGKVSGLSGDQSAVAQALFGTSSDADLLNKDYDAAANSTALTAAQKAVLAKAKRLSQVAAQGAQSALKNTVSGSVTNATDGLESLAYFQRVLNNPAPLTALTSGATPTEIDNALRTFKGALSQSEIDRQRPLAADTNTLSLGDLMNQPDWPTNYYKFKPSIMVGASSNALSLKDVQYALTPTTSSSLDLSSNEFVLASSATTSGSQWNRLPTPQDNLFVWDGAKSAFVATGSIAGPTLSVDVNGNASIAGNPVSVDLRQVKLAGLNVSQVAYHAVDGLADVPLDKNAAFPADSYLYRLRLSNQNPVLISGVANANSAASPDTLTTEPLSQVVGLGTPPAGVSSGTMYMGVNGVTSTGGTSGDLLLANDGNLYLFAVQSAPSSTTTSTTSSPTTGGQVAASTTWVKVGQYTEVPASKSLPAYYKLDLNDGVKVGMGADDGWTSVIVPGSASGTAYLGDLVDAGGQVFSGALFDKTARDAIVAALKMPIAVTP